MALAQVQGTAERSYSMSAQTEAKRHDYFLILERCKRGGPDITAWLERFLAVCGRPWMERKRA